jgi:hypothetical protein
MMESISAIIYMIVGVGVAVMVLMFIGLLGGVTYTQIEPDLDEIGMAVFYQNFSASNTTPVALTHTIIQRGTISFTNTTNAITLKNFTIDYAAGTVLLNVTAGGNVFQGVSLNTTYTWQNNTIPESVKRGVISGFSALESTGDFLPIIVLAIVIVIILGLVLGLTALRGDGMGGMRGTAL